MIECCCIDVDDPVQLARHDIRKARKEHKCEECGEPIAKGQRYEYSSTLFDAMWSHQKTCLPCVGIRRDFFSCGFYYGRLREDFIECQGWDYVTGKVHDQTLVAFREKPPEPPKSKPGLTRVQ